MAQNGQFRRRADWCLVLAGSVLMACGTQSGEGTAARTEPGSDGRPVAISAPTPSAPRREVGASARTNPTRATVSPTTEGTTTSTTSTNATPSSTSTTLVTSSAEEASPENPDTLSGAAHGYGTGESESAKDSEKESGEPADKGASRPSEAESNKGRVYGCPSEDDLQRFLRSRPSDDELERFADKLLKCSADRSRDSSEEGGKGRFGAVSGKT